MIFRYTIIIYICLSLSGCGFQLRGSNLEALQNSSVYVRSNGADRLANEVKRQLRNADIIPVNSAEKAEYIITLSNENFIRTVLSVSPETGKVEEYEMSYSATMSITSSQGKTLVNSEPILAERDYTFDEDAVLGKFTEETVLQKDIANQAAAAVLRRLQVITK